MKRNRLFFLIALFPVFGTLRAQTSYEAAALLDADLSGTARFVGMGGAMSALGTDISVMGTNPAGTGLYRSWDAAMSFGGNWNTQHAESNMGRSRLFDSYGSFDNIGVVIANKKSNEKALRFVNFGFNYRNVKRFDGKMGMSSDLNNKFSQTGQMAWQAFENENVRYEDFDMNIGDSFYNKNYYKADWAGWLTLLGADARLIDMTSLGGVIDGVEYPKGYFIPSYENSYTERQSGGIDAYDFNLSFNFFDAVYLGATMTTYDVNRTLESTYSEEFYGGGYTLDNYYRTVGSGYDFKFGLIVRPFVESSFRIGVSATTPTVYTLRDYNYAVIKSTVTFDEYDANNQFVGQFAQSFAMDTRDKAAFGGECYTDYTIVAPAKFNASLGGTIGSSLALGAEYEYSNYGATKLYYYNGYENMAMNEHTAEHFTGHHTLRLGAEKTFGAFYTRVGYNYQSGGYRSDAWKMIPVNSVQTNTAYANLKYTANYTCGIGFRGDTFYADVAFLYGSQVADFYPFDDPGLPAARLMNNKMKGMMTVGIRL